MIDYAKINVKAGNGGAGAASFRHIKGKRYGKADGGNGGHGGHVYLEATRDLNTLEPYRFVKDYKAQDGVSGSSNLRRGADGQDLVLKVPVGTLVKSHFDFDLVHDSEQILVARGGGGGRGNARLRDEFGRRPRKGEPGAKGEELNLTLELKLIADVGLIGLPNAGKSTLLSALTSARPKIADYPFTTLEPNLGVLEVAGPAGLYPRPSPTRLVLADIPGLIEGASEGRGLGDLFLRHIERTKVLVHLIDMSNVSKTSDTSILWRDYQTVRAELKKYSRELARKKPEIIVLTKTDLVNQSEVTAALNLFKSRKKRIIAISAAKNQGLAELVKIIIKLVNQS